MIGIEAQKNHEFRKQSGFYERYMSGVGLDIGFKGMDLHPLRQPIVLNATGVDIDYPGYDGTHLPFETTTQDFVFSSHCLEHIANYTKTLQEWHRVLKVGGYMVILVPHGFLYERSFYIPGPWGSCDDHKRVYTPSRLLREVEESLLPNSYRIVSLRDVDTNFDYAVDPKIPPDYLGWSFEIECVLKKIRLPDWKVV
jgi:predicted SAM-dependent methyltransferase